MSGVVTTGTLFQRNIMSPVSTTSYQQHLSGSLQTAETSQFLQSHSSENIVPSSYSSMDLSSLTRGITTRQPNKLLTSSHNFQEFMKYSGQQSSSLQSSVLHPARASAAGPSSNNENLFSQATLGCRSYEGTSYFDSMERKHTCNICHKAFKLRHHLVEHVVIHNDEKPFKCPACPFRTKRTKQVKYHVRLRHPEIDVTHLVLLPSPENVDD